MIGFHLPGEETLLKAREMLVDKQQMFSAGRAWIGLVLEITGQAAMGRWGPAALRAWTWSGEVSFN